MRVTLAGPVGDESLAGWRQQTVNGGMTDGPQLVFQAGWDCLELGVFEQEGTIGSDEGHQMH